MGYAISFYIVSFIVSIFNPFLGFVGLTSSILIRFQDRYPEIAAMKPFTLLLIGMMLGCFINRDRLSKLSWKQDRFLVYLLLVSMMGLLLKAPGELIWQTWEFSCALAFYFFATRLLQKDIHFIVLFSAMSLCILYMAYEAIESVALDPLKTPFIRHSTGRWKGIGLYSNANEFGQLMITTIPFLLAIILLRKSIILSLISICIVGVMTYVLGKTMSRTCMLTLGIMVILTFALRGEGKVVTKMMASGVIAVMVIGMLSFVPGPIRDRLNTVRDAGEDESFQGRVRAWEQGIDMFLWYPITGVGKSQWGNYHGLAPHSSFVQILAELGFFGILLFASIVTLSFKEFKPILIPSNPDPPRKNKKSRKSFLKNDQLNDKSVRANNRRGEGQVDEIPVSVTSDVKTIAIAVVTMFIGFLIYISVGNHGYSVWTYFYIGVCAAIRNLITVPVPPKKRSFKKAKIGI